jgi:hypothetical protein
LDSEPFPIETGCQESRPPQAARFRAPLTARFNRNFRRQEIDGELRRPLQFEAAADRRDIVLRKNRNCSNLKSKFAEGSPRRLHLDCPSSSRSGTQEGQKYTATSGNSRGKARKTPNRRAPPATP